MAKVAAIQVNFNAGELSPLMYGRVDLDKYGGALKTCLNTIPLVQGGWSRRPGTIFVAETKDSTKAIRLVKFQYSVTQAYLLEFGHNFIRFYKNNAPILEAAKTITGATQTNPVVITSVAHGFSNGDDIEITSVDGMVELNGRRVRVANVTANTFEITTLQGTNIDGTAFSGGTTNGNASRVYTLTTSYASTDLFQLKFAQSADVMWIVHPSYAPRKLTRLADANWTWSGIDYLHGPYLDPNTTSTTLTPSATTGSGVTLTASSTTGVNGGAGFQSTDVNRLVRIQHGSAWGWAKITGWTSTTVVTITIVSDFGSATASATWRLGVYSDYAGWPSCIAFFENRLVYSGAPANRERVDLSVTGSYDDFRPTAADGTVLANYAISVAATAGEVQAIRWMVPDEKGLVLGTINGESVLRSSTTGEALSANPLNAKITQSTDVGSADVQAVRAGKAVLMLDRTKENLHEIAYVYTDDGFRSPDMSVLAEHIGKGGLAELTYQRHPQPVIWAPRADGVLVGMTYNREQSVVGWHRHLLGGVTDTGSSVPVAVESVCALPSADTTYYDLWVATRRRVGGSTKRCIEYMGRGFERGDNQGAAHYVDFGVLRHDDAAGTAFDKLWHLVGETVIGHYDGKSFGPTVVPASGTITLPGPAFRKSVGLAYQSDGETLRNNAGAADGTAQGKTQRTHRVAFRFHETGEPFKIGKSFDAIDNLPDDKGAEEILFRSTEDLSGVATPFFSGDKSRPWPGDYALDNTICWRAEGPFPATLLAVFPQLDTQDR